MILVDYIDHNKYTRPEIKRSRTSGIVMHSTAVAGATAYNQRDSFNRSHVQVYRSAHYAVGWDGAVIAIIPNNEKAYHCGAWKYQEGIVKKLGPDPNMTTIGIEMCHKYQNGRLETITLFYAQLLVVHLCFKYDLNPCSDVFRHYDITGKQCPLWWVQYPQEYLKFQLAVKKAMCMDIGAIKP